MSHPSSDSSNAMNLSSFGDREDNHCQEDGQAKSAWRETRLLGDLGIDSCLLFHCLIKRDTIPSLYRWADLTRKKPISKFKEITN